MGVRAAAESQEGSRIHSKGAQVAPCCCPHYHEAIELVGRRWTGAILAVLLDTGSMRFSALVQAVPEISDRLLSERVKEFEARGLVERTVYPGPPVRVEYGLTAMGRELGPVIGELTAWARRWL
jgi:DNA-binding HxlR family transcriptional regulator